MFTVLPKLGVAGNSAIMNVEPVFAPSSPGCSSVQARADSGGRRADCGGRGDLVGAQMRGKS